MFPEFVEKLVSGDKVILAKLLSLVESEALASSSKVEEIFSSLPENDKSFRIGVSGPPGVGKSTFIEALGQKLIVNGHKVAVLAFDPKSPVSGGSILGDKTRMQKLVKEKNAYIRPVAGGVLGGLHPAALEMVVLLEASGFDRVIVETVGIGQSEFHLTHVVDMTLTLIQPGSGDELQGMKRGILELVDLVLINKSDGELETPAKRALVTFEGILKLLKNPHSFYDRKVLAMSALNNLGIEEVIKETETFYKKLSTDLLQRRHDQAEKWFWVLLTYTLQQQLSHKKENIHKSIELIRQGKMRPLTVAWDMAEKL